MAAAELADAGAVVVPDSGDGTRPPVAFDFRRPGKFSRESVRSLQNEHEVFSRRMASGWGNTLRALVQLEPLGIDQISYDDYIRSMPNPTMLAVVAVPPLPGAVVIEVNVQLALLLVDRLLGGRGGAGAELAPVPRRPTELETFLLADLMGHAVSALDETLQPLVEATVELQSIEYKPQLVQVAAPSDMALLLSYRVGVSQGVQADGLLTVCYPSATLTPILDRLASRLWTEQGAAEGDEEGPQDALVDRLADIDVDLSVRLADSAVPARALASLQPGDVITLDHRVGQPARGTVSGIDVLAGHLGRRGRRRALQLSGWSVTDVPKPARHDRRNP